MESGRVNDAARVHQVVFTEELQLTGVIHVRQKQFRLTVLLHPAGIGIRGRGEGFRRVAFRLCSVNILPGREQIFAILQGEWIVGVERRRERDRVERMLQERVEPGRNAEGERVRREVAQLGRLDLFWGQIGGFARVQPDVLLEHQSVGELLVAHWTHVEHPRRRLGSVHAHVRLHQTPIDIRLISFQLRIQSFQALVIIVKFLRIIALNRADSTRIESQLNP